LPFEQMYDWHVELSVHGAPSGDRGAQVIVDVSHEEVVRHSPASDPAQELPSARRGAHCEPLVPVPAPQ
jgi:hypothetical protein